MSYYEEKAKHEAEEKTKQAALAKKMHRITAGVVAGAAAFIVALIPLLLFLLDM